MIKTSIIISNITTIICFSCRHLSSNGVKLYLKTTTPPHYQVLRLFKSKNKNFAFVRCVLLSGGRFHLYGLFFFVIHTPIGSTYKGSGIAFLACL